MYRKPESSYALLRFQKKEASFSANPLEILASPGGLMLSGFPVFPSKLGVSWHSNDLVYLGFFAFHGYNGGSNSGDSSTNRHFA